MNNKLKRLIQSFLILILLQQINSYLYGKNIDTFTNNLVEIKLTSPINYPHPILDVLVECEITNSEGYSFTVDGFWDGENIFKVRFALPNPGLWHYHISCNDTQNVGLHNIIGTVNVKPYTGSNQFYLHGWLKIAEEKHYLAHADNKPFFYLGDTAWEITWKSDSISFLDYIKNRKSKGFSAIQMVAMTHQNYRFREYGVFNRSGESFYLDNDFTRLNPRYFDYLDFIVRTANDSGIVIALVPLWASMMELYPIGYANQLSISESLILAKYIGSRYAGSNIIWIIGGDNEYDTEERKNFWTEFANIIKKTTGQRQLLTLHPRGWAASFYYFDNYTDWLSFHMYQSSHHAWADFPWLAGSKGYKLYPPKPVLNGEACYEDIYHNLWEPQDTTHVNTFRIEPVHVRQASYESIFSGAMVGITYGANGIFQWSTKEDPGGFRPQFTADQAWNLPGSYHMKILKNIMTHYNWYSLKPDQDLLVFFKSEENHIPIASSQTHILAYLPPKTDTVVINTCQLDNDIAWYFINPTTGDSTLSTISSSFTSDLKISPPDSSDWFLVITSINAGGKKIPIEFELFQNYPNPFNTTTNIEFILHRTSDIKVKIFNILGEEVTTLVSARLKADSYTYQWDATNFSSGIYLYRFSVVDPTGEAGEFIETKKMVLMH